MVCQSIDGFTDADLEKELRRAALGADASIRIVLADNGSLELHGAQGLMVVACPAGREPYDYLLVDFPRYRGWAEGPQIGIMAALAEGLELSVLEIETGIEYSASRWASVCGRVPTNPSENEGAAARKLEGEAQFYERLGIPLSPDELGTLREAVASLQDADIQRLARSIRDNKKLAIRAQKSSRRQDARSLGGRRWWPFPKNQDPPE